jgi:hypothetical protein
MNQRILAWRRRWYGKRIKVAFFGAEVLAGQLEDLAL